MGHRDRLAGEARERAFARLNEVEQLVELLDKKSLHYIEVIEFDLFEEDDNDDDDDGEEDD